MASGTTGTNTCTECGRLVEVLNSDLNFPLNLHKQSHTVSNNKYCSKCKEPNELTNSDQKHKPEEMDSMSENSTARRKRRTKKKTRKKEEAGTNSESTNIVESIFDQMDIGLKAHFAFISENGCGKVTCSMCEITIDPIFSVAEHLKTKLHEDNTILIIKTLIPSEVQDQMDFVSFYGSNLYCNLCESKIDLCSKNLHKTVINIFAHNSSRGHWSKMSNKDSSSNQSDNPLTILKMLALMDPLVNENQHLIEYKTNPYYSCKVCHQKIDYCQNGQELLKNIKYHLNSPQHKKSCIPQIKSLFCSTNQNQSISAQKNNCFDHSPSFSKETAQETVGSNVCAYKPTPSERKKVPCSTSKMSETIETGIKVQFQTLLEINQTIKANSVYLENIDDKYFCKLCKSNMQSGVQLQQLKVNLLSHLNGKKHKRKLVKEFKRIQVEIEDSNSVIGANKKFLTKKHGNAFCILCDCEIPVAVDVDLIQNITNHLEGTGHITNKLLAEKSNVAASAGSEESEKN